MSYCGLESKLCAVVFPTPFDLAVKFRQKEVKTHSEVHFNDMFQLLHDMFW